MLVYNGSPWNAYQDINYCSDFLPLINNPVCATPQTLLRCVLSESIQPSPPYHKSHLSF